MAAIGVSWQQRIAMTATNITCIASYRASLALNPTCESYRPLSAKSRSAAPSRR